MIMGVGRGEQGGAPPSWIFIHDTDNVERGLMVLFFGLVFSLPPSSWKVFCRRPRTWRDGKLQLKESLAGKQYRIDQKAFSESVNCQQGSN